MVQVVTDEKKKAGVLLRTALNDLKRTPEVVSQETGLEVPLIESVLSGESEKQAEILRTLTTHYPLDLKHVLVNHDTSTNGIWHMSKDASEKSARVFDRTNANGDTGPYYRYMDTAMAALAPFKPELIEMLAEVEDNEAMNPKVVMNRGHLLAQQTFFIGPVNFYCTVRGERQCIPMNTGDSCIITPYVPHSFATRAASKYSAIVAVTFSTGVRDVLPDLLNHDTTRMLECAADARDPKTCRIMRLQRFAELRGLEFSDIDAILDQHFGKKEENKRTVEEENQVLSEVLNVPISFLAVEELKKDCEVCYAFGSKLDDAQPGSNVKKTLATAKHMADSGGYEWQLNKDGELDCQLFNYIYNYGEETVVLKTCSNSHEQLIAPGDSVVLKPFVKVVCGPVESSKSAAKLIVVKVSGGLGMQVINEMATFDADGRNRMTTDLTRWY